MLDDYFPFLVYAFLAAAIPASMILFTFLFAQPPKGRVKARFLPFESGVSEGPPAQQRFTVSFYLTAMLFIVFDGAGVEAEPVLEAGAAAALNCDAQDRALALRILGHQLADLVRGVRGQGNESVGALDDLHRMMVAGAKVVPRRVTL